MNAWREGNKACREVTEACLEKVTAETDVERKEMKTCREGAGACLKREANPKEVGTVAERRDVPNEKAAVEAIGALEDRYGDGRLVVRHR
jgi:hypothetical protein